MAKMMQNDEIAAALALAEAIAAVVGDAHGHERAALADVVDPHLDELEGAVAAADGCEWALVDELADVAAVLLSLAEDFPRAEAEWIVAVFAHRLSDALVTALAALSECPGDAGDRLARAVLTRRAFRAWRADNPRAWAEAEGFVREASEAGRVVGGPAIVAALRRRDFTDDRGAMTRINNDFSPLFARAIASEHPELAKAIETRRSVFDALLGIGGCNV